jgi:hypothetical protein
VATSSSPFQSHSQGDEDIAAPDELIIRRVPPCGAVFKIGSSHLKLPPPRRDQARATNPNGILAPSPGLPSLRGYPGSSLDWVPTAKRLWPFRLGNVVVRDRIEEATTALRLDRHPPGVPRVVLVPRINPGLQASTPLALLRDLKLGTGIWEHLPLPLGDDRSRRCHEASSCRRAQHGTGWRRPRRRWKANVRAMRTSPPRTGASFAAWGHAAYSSGFTGWPAMSIRVGVIIRMR